MSRVIELQTGRVHLRPFRAEDVADALAYRNDPEFALYLPHIPQPFMLEDAEAFVRQNMSEPWETSPVFAVVLREDGPLIGTVNFEIDPPDAAKRWAMLGYAIGRQWWGRGLATEAARAAVTWAIEAYGLTRLWAATDVRNVHSQRVLESLGMRQERVRVADHVGRDGAHVTEVVYAMEISSAELSPRDECSPNSPIRKTELPGR